MSHPVAGLMRQCGEQINAACLGMARLLPEFEKDRGYVADGCPNTVAWLKANCDMSAPLAMHVLSVSRALPQLPEVEKAAVTGELTFEHALVIADSVGRVGAGALLEHQAELLVKASDATPDAFRLEVKRVEERVDAELLLRQRRWAFESRRLSVVTKLDGRVRVEGLLDPEGGLVFRKALEAVLGSRSQGETRSEEQRRADGLVDIAKGGSKPHLSVFIDESGQGCIDGVGPVSRETIERMACDAAISVNGSPETRTFNSAKRRAIARRSRTCMFPRCDAPSDWCEGHHIREFRHGGETVPGNGAQLCSFHHHLFHEGGWRMELRDGELRVCRPDGSLYWTGPAPPS